MWLLSNALCVTVLEAVAQATVNLMTWKNVDGGEILCNLWTNLYRDKNFWKIKKIGFGM